MRFSAVAVGQLLPQRLVLHAQPFLDRVDATLLAADERGEARRMSAIAFAICIVMAIFVPAPSPRGIF